LHGKPLGITTSRHAFIALLLYRIRPSFVHRTGVFAHCNAGTLAPPSGRQIQELPMFVSYILAKVQAYFRYRETIRELSLLSDRELTDLGIARFQIDSIARQGAAS
jgi:uncharacterized protein YjiS (DUF1127 family)